MLFVRTIGSTVVGQGFDSFIFIYIASWLGSDWSAAALLAGPRTVDHEDPLRDRGHAPYLRGRHLHEAQGKDGCYGRAPFAQPTGDLRLRRVRPGSGESMCDVASGGEAGLLGPGDPSYPQRRSPGIFRQNFGGQMDRDTATLLADLHRLVQPHIRRGRFELTDGQSTDWYVDGRSFMLSPEGGSLAGRRIADCLPTMSAP